MMLFHAWVRGGVVVRVGHLDSEGDLMASDEKLSEVVSLRFTPSEMEQLRAFAAGRKLSQVVRDLALQTLNDHTTRRHSVVDTRTGSSQGQSVAIITGPVEMARRTATITYLDPNMTISR